MVNLKNITIIPFMFLLFSSLLNANVAQKIAKKLNISAGSKAALQWERVFKSDRKMKRYKIYTLSDIEKEKLKEYLISHAIDSDRPTVAGE